MKRENIKELEKIKLWTKAGGRCELCNKYLLRDNFTTLFLNLGEMAHNVGATEGKKSPRGRSKLSVSKRNLESNLLLLCSDHHKNVDKIVKKFGITKLREIKRNHESRIRHLTGYPEKNKSVVVRLIGRIRANSVSCSDEEVWEALTRCEKRYPDYKINTLNNIEINLLGLSDVKIDSTYWESGIRIIDEAINIQIEPLINQKKIKHLSVFPFARIPFLIYFGFKMRDHVPLDIYQKQRNRNADWIWDGKAKKVTFEYRLMQKGRDKSKIAVLMSLSGLIDRNKLPQDINKNYFLYELKPTNRRSDRDLITGKLSLVEFRKTFQKFLRNIESEHNNASEIHLFLATPLSASVEIGREIMKSVTPNFIVYDLEGNEYKKALIIKT